MASASGPRSRTGIGAPLDAPRPPLRDVVAGLRLSGLDAPMLLDGPMNGDAFLADGEKVLAPTLRPGGVVIMDNLSSH